MSLNIIPSNYVHPLWVGASTFLFAYYDPIGISNLIQSLTLYFATEAMIGAVVGTFIVEKLMGVSDEGFSLWKVLTGTGLGAAIGVILATFVSESRMLISLSGAAGAIFMSGGIHALS